MLTQRRLLTTITCSTLLFLVTLTCAPWTNAAQEKLQLYQIQQAIEQKGARWFAEENEISTLPIEELRQLLGFIPSGEEVMYGDDNVLDDYAYGQALPAKFDWRNYNGKNYATSVKQQRCGDCWAFATVGALEMRLAIDNRSSQDLSEQLLVSTCSNAGNCSGGYIGQASQFIVNLGTPDENCYPYLGRDSACSQACSGWQSQAYRPISTTRVAQTVEAIKTAVYTRGPVNVGFMVYTDFSSYSSGIYEHTSGIREGGHAVIVVGYDDSQGCFIVKNSWGSHWGENGYFRIAYSQVNNEVAFGRDAHCYGDEIDHNVPPDPDPQPPEAPNLQSTRVGDGAVTLAWQNVANATGYTIHYGTTSGYYTEVVDVGAATNHTVTGLTNLQRYYFAIVAYSSAGESKPSNELDAVPTDSNPNPNPNPADNLIINPGFEDGSLAPWRENFCGSSMLTQEQVHSGSFSVLDISRDAFYCGVQQDLTGKLKNGVSYQFSARMRLKNKTSDTGTMALRILDDNGYRYLYINSDTITDSGWTKIGAEHTMELAGTPQELTLIIYGPDQGVDFYVDDVVIKDPETPVPSDPYEITVEKANELIRNNAQNQNFTLLDVRTPEEFQVSHISGALNLDYYAANFEAQIDALDPSKSYLIYCRTQNRSGNTADMMKSKGFSDFHYMFGGIIEWTEKGYPVVKPDPTPDPANNMVANPGFEDGMEAPWEAHFGGYIAVTGEQAHSGNYSLLDSGRYSDWSGVYQTITDTLKNGETYEISAWVRLKNASQGTIRMLLKIEDDAGQQIIQMDPVTASNSQWVMIGGEHTLNLSGAIRVVAIHIYGPYQGVEFYVDDVQFKTAGSPDPDPDPEAPIITSIPVVTQTGGVIVINGNDFDPVNSRVSIQGNGVDTWGTVLLRTASRITVNNPDYANGRYQVTVYNGSLQSNTRELIIDCGG